MKRIISLGIILLLSVCMKDMQAGDTAVKSSRESVIAKKELETAIEKVMENPAYSWRIAKESVKDGKNTLKLTFLSNFADKFNKWLDKMAKAVTERLRKLDEYLKEIEKKINRWLSYKQGKDRKVNEIGSYVNIYALIFVLLAVVLSLLAILIVRHMKSKSSAVVVQVKPMDVIPDIKDENVTASQMNYDGWMLMAEQLISSGEIKLAIRAMFLSCLAYLSECERLSIARYKSNREYLAELNRRAHDFPDILKSFSVNIGLFEDIWYGERVATAEIYQLFKQNHSVIYNLKTVMTVAKNP